MPKKEPKRFQREVSYKMEKGFRFDKYGRDTKSKADAWKKTRAARFKAPLLPKPTLVSRGGPAHAAFGQRAREFAEKRFFS